MKKWVVYINVWSYTKVIPVHKGIKIIDSFDTKKQALEFMENYIAKNKHSKYVYKSIGFWNGIKVEKATSILETLNYDSKLWNKGILK